jgi:hypothetical protein
MAEQFKLIVSKSRQKGTEGNAPPVSGQARPSLLQCEENLAVWVMEAPALTYTGGYFGGHRQSAED